MIIRSFSTQNQTSLCSFNIDCVTLQHLSIESARLITQVLAQTVGLEYYESAAGTMLDEFRRLSAVMSKTGTLSLSNFTANTIIQLMSRTNHIMTSLITQLKLLDRSEIVWSHGQYNTLYNGLRSEFDLVERFTSMETKLNLLHSNHPLFLEMLHHDRSIKLELIIIYLIAIEVLLAVCFHSPIIPYIRKHLFGQDDDDDDNSLMNNKKQHA